MDGIRYDVSIWQIIKNRKLVSVMRGYTQNELQLHYRMEWVFM